MIAKATRANILPAFGLLTIATGRTDLRCVVYKADFHREYFLSPLAESEEESYSQKPIWIASLLEKAISHALLVVLCRLRYGETWQLLIKQLRSDLTKFSQRETYLKTSLHLPCLLSKVQQPSLSSKPLTKCGSSSSLISGHASLLDLSGHNLSVTKSFQTLRLDIRNTLYVGYLTIWQLPPSKLLAFSIMSKSPDVKSTAYPSFRRLPSPYIRPSNHALSLSNGRNLQAPIRVCRRQPISCDSDLSLLIPADFTISATFVFEQPRTSAIWRVDLPVS